VKIFIYVCDKRRSWRQIIHNEHVCTREKQGTRFDKCVPRGNIPPRSDNPPRQLSSSVQFSSGTRQTVTSRPQGREDHVTVRRATTFPVTHGHVRCSDNSAGTRGGTLWTPSVSDRNLARQRPVTPEFAHIHSQPFHDPLGSSSCDGSGLLPDTPLERSTGLLG